ncbi:MAG: glycosyltransferase family 4 protein [Candidatus Solibacter usitatus]|nr:glycosyltransferase family 4 protein [Candidatus Solibacter usitatus]
MRIVFDARHLRDFGVGTYIRNLLRGLSMLDSQNQYLLVTGTQDASQLSGFGPNFKTVIYQGRDTDRLDPIRFGWFVRGLHADLSHIPYSAVPWMMPKPYIVTVHDVSRLLYDQPPGWRSHLRRYRFRHGLLRASAIITVSGATKGDLEGLVDVPPEKMRLIYNAPDPRFFEHGPPMDARAAGPDMASYERKRILERYQITFPYLVYAGTIRPQKNIPRLVEAFAVLRGELEQHPVYKDIRLVIIGDEISRYPSVRRAVVQTRMDAFVRFLGFVPFDTLRVFYEAAEAFVFPSLYEGFGLPPLEAMACGTPVVASNVSSLPEVVGEAAVTVNPENVFDIARGLRDVLLDTDLRVRLRRAGLEQAAKFSWERTAREVLTVYGTTIR